MKILFNEIPLDQISVSHDHEWSRFTDFGILYCCREEQGVSQGTTFGNHPNDILKEFMVRNTYIYPPEPSMKIMPIFSNILLKISLKFN